MIPRIGEQNITVPSVQPHLSAHNSKARQESYAESKEIDQLAAKFSNSGMYTEESSKILAKNILKGSFDVYA